MEPPGSLALTDVGQRDDWATPNDLLGFVQGGVPYGTLRKLVSASGDLGSLHKGRDRSPAQGWQICGQIPGVTRRAHP
jgi:hypothetical protein